MARPTPMGRQTADRISAAARRNPTSPTATSGFDRRSRDATDCNQVSDPYEYEDYSYDH